MFDGDVVRVRPSTPLSDLADRVEANDLLYLLDYETPAAGCEPFAAAPSYRVAGVDGVAGEITIEFDKPVFDLGTGGPLVIGSFVVASTGGSPPTVTAVDPVVGVPDAYTLTLSGPSEPGQWTPVVPPSTDASGHLSGSGPWTRSVTRCLAGGAGGV